MALSTFRFLSFTLSLALDTSIISQTHNHDQLNWRSDGEVMVIYEGWLIKHQNVYNGLEEEDARFQVFKDNLKLIDERNTQKHTYKLGLNRFADLSNGEYRAMYLGTKTDNDKRRRVMKAKSTARRYAYYAGDVLPLHVDWRMKGAIKPIKDQKSGARHRVRICSRKNQSIFSFSFTDPSPWLSYVRKRRCCYSCCFFTPLFRAASGNLRPFAREEKKASMNCKKKQTSHHVAKEWTFFFTIVRPKASNPSPFADGDAKNGGNVRLVDPWRW